MSQTKQIAKRKRRRKAVPVLGAASLSLSLAGGASAALGPTSATATAASAPPAQQMTLHEEEISDISLATFHVFDKENAPTQQRRPRLALGACGSGGCGCGGCGCACGTGLYYHYTPPVFGKPVYPPPPPPPPHRRLRTPHKHDYYDRTYYDRTIKR